MSILLSAFRWVLSASVMASVMAVIIMLVKLLVKNRFGARWHYYIWILVLVRLLVPYAPQSPVSIFNASALLEVPAGYAGSGIAAASSNWMPPAAKDGIKAEIYDNSKRGFSESTAVNNINKAPIAVIVPCIMWLSGMVLSGAYTCITTMRFSGRLKTQGHCTDDGVMELVSCCKDSIGLKGKVDIVFTGLVKTPAAFGFFRPVVLLPLCYRFSPDELRLVLLHELTHIKHKDLILSGIMRVLHIIHWFNPILGYAFHNMRLDCELACDAFVMSRLEPSLCRKYGQTIIALLENFSKHNRVCGMAGIIEGKSQIKRRIMMISRFKKDKYRWSAVSVFVFAALGLMLLTNAQELKTVNKTIGSTATEGIHEAMPAKDITADKISKMLVVIDPGHGGSDNGAVYKGKHSGSNIMAEKDLNLDMALQLCEMLKKSGVKVKLTREEDRKLELKDRTELANGAGADLFVSIHCGAGKDTEHGTVTFFNSSADYSAYNMTGEAASGLLQKELVKVLQTEDNGTYSQDSLAVLKNTNMPSVITQIAYISEQTDMKKLMDRAFRAKAAKAMHDGILKILYEMAAVPIPAE